jgi:RNA polymerase sigma factor (TIGR02999 family)
LPQVYDELRSLASSYLRRESSGHTLETGALVHEAFLRLVDQERVQWQNRAQFFGIAAQMMRRILVDHARSHLYLKRGGGERKLSLDEALTLSAERAPELVALDEALQDLDTIAPQAARIVELRFFAGLTSEEIAHVLGVSVPTVTRGWRMARAWLYRHLSGEDALGA